MHFTAAGIGTYFAASVALRLRLLRQRRGVDDFDAFWASGHQPMAHRG